MTLKIEDTEITSPDTQHLAVRKSLTEWRVTWLPHKLLTRNQAITAMTIAATVGASDHEITRTDPIWRHFTGWAAELGIPPEYAARNAAKPRMMEV